MFSNNNQSYINFETLSYISDSTFTIDQIPDNSHIDLKEPGCLKTIFNSQVTKVINLGNVIPYQYKMLYKVPDYMQHNDKNIDFASYIEQLLYIK
jgi:hypothetical protein